MKILFEEYQYNTEDVRSVLGNFVLSGLDYGKTTQQLRYVGYFYNAEIENRDGSKGDLVFFLPKVLLDQNGLAFGIEPKRLLNFNWEDWKKDEFVVESGSLTKRQVYEFIYGFSTWIYRAVDIYRANQKKHPKKEDLEANVMTSVQIGQSGKKENVTFMDVLLSLLDFQKTHQGFITFVMKMAHSGFNKISWPKTIARTAAILQDGVPLYLNPINKKREIDFDEELLIIYYSILNYMHEEYGFPIPNQPGYKLITGAMFKSYIKIQGKTRLHKIRYKYYSDSAVLLWNLCYAFFDKVDNLKAQTNRKDYLLVNSFHYVFEAMIDELIGDKDLPRHLKNGEDDKRIDHLYTYKYLIENLDQVQDPALSRKIYNIADSKYYRRDEKLRGHDVPKQFTYARNVTQWHMDLLHDILHDKPKFAKNFKAIPLFDKITEGYNIIPNFFVSAKVEDDLNYNHDGFGRTTMNDDKFAHESFHFWDRLFDRDTLFTLHYDVNFLYVLKLYAQNKNHDKVVWQERIRGEFRKHILEHLNNTYKFYQILIPSTEIEQFVDRHFRKLNGKLFSFMPEDKRILILAERKSTPDDGTFDRSENQYNIDLENLELSIIERGESYLYNIKDITLGETTYDLIEEIVEPAVVATQQDVDDITAPSITDVSFMIEDDVDDTRKFVDYLPLYSIRAACGNYEENYVGEINNDMGWIEATSLHRTLHNGMFVIQAIGDSMEDTISNGDYCVFEWYSPERAGSREDKIVLAQGLDSNDGDYGGRYTIKKYHRKSQDEVLLQPLNYVNHNDLPLTEESDVSILAVYVGNLRR